MAACRSFSWGRMQPMRISTPAGLFPTCFLTGAVLSILVAANDQPNRRISLDELRDKIAGGWAGQMVGVSFGAPTEFRYREQIIEGSLPEWKPERVSNAIVQDDLYVDMTFAQVLDEKE